MRIGVLAHTFPKTEHDATAAFMGPFATALAGVVEKVVVVVPFVPGLKKKRKGYSLIPYKYIKPDSLHLMGYSKTMKADLELSKIAFLLIPFMVIFGTLKLIVVSRYEKLNLVNAHWILPNGLMAMLSSVFTKVPYVCTLPGTDLLLVKKSKVFAFVSRIIVNNSAGLVSNSQWLLNEFRKHVRFSDKVSTRIINYPVDVSSLRPSAVGVEKLRSELEIGPNQVVIVAVGRLVYKKGYAYLIRALVKVKNSTLVLVGDGDTKSELVILAKKLKLENRVVFAGTIERNKLSEYYNLADIFCAPSIIDQNGNADGGPVSVAEAMACGKPIVLTDILGMSGVVGTNGGVVVPQKSASKLGVALANLATNEKMRLEMGRNNLATARNKLGTRWVGKQYLDFINSII